ncbi:MAG TPA: glycosyltransferase, partial [Gaiellaceae bacterium]|nr:glycosyltransferase [Gaiellaceae bacterium]
VDVSLYPLLRHREATVHPEARALVERANYLPFLSWPILRSQLHFLRRRPRAYLGALAAVSRGTLGSLNFFFGGLAIFPKVAHAARLMEAEGVTHVHCHFANHPAVAGLVIRRLTGIPFSFTAHGSDLHVERRMLPQKVAEAEFVATISHDNRRLIVAECGEAAGEKVHVVRAGIDTEAFAPRGERNGHEGLRIVCVGTLHEVKGQAVLVEACRLLAARGIELECRLVGDGPDRDALRSAIESGGLDGRVHLVGPQPREAVAATLEWADALATPSVPTRSGKREGIPVVLMEAMSSGLPVVASRLSGIPELVEDGVSGLLVPHGDAEALANALERLARDPLLRRRLGRRGRLTVEREFDVDRSAALLAERFR